MVAHMFYARVIRSSFIAIIPFTRSVH